MELLIDEANVLEVAWAEELGNVSSVFSYVAVLVVDYLVEHETLDLRT